MALCRFADLTRWWSPLMKNGTKYRSRPKVSIYPRAFRRLNRFFVVSRQPGAASTGSSPVSPLRSVNRQAVTINPPLRGPDLAELAAPLPALQPEDWATHGAGITTSGQTRFNDSGDLDQLCCFTSAHRAAQGCTLTKQSIPQPAVASALCGRCCLLWL